MIPMVIPIAAYSYIRIRNNIVALKMIFIHGYITETKISDRVSQEISISKQTTEVTLEDYSKHLLYINLIRLLYHV